MFEKESHTPKSWITATLDQICSHPQYGWTCKACSGGDVKLLRTTDISSGTIDWATVPFCTEIPKKETDYHLTEGDIVVSRAGSVGKSFIIKGSVPRAVFASYLVRFKPYIERLYVYYFMQSRMYWEQIEEKSAGIAVPNVNGSKLAKIVLPVAPLNGQKRIVDKIEQLFSNLDEGEALLKQVQKQLGTYRQSVLKAAVTGELTKEWREANKHRLESGDALLKRILKTRRDNWNGRGKYKEPVSPDISRYTELAAGWIWVSVEQILSEGLSNGRSVPDASDGFPVLRLTALKNGIIDIEERKIGAWSAKEADPFTIKFGDFLVSRGNGSKHLVGRGGLVSIEPPPVAYPDTLIRIRTNPLYINKEFLSYVWNSYFVRQQIEIKAKTTAGIYKINQGDICSFSLPLPTINEQKEIVSICDDIFSQIDALENWCATELARSTTLRQSILKDAFSGKLVPQDPTDEPASELLKRIQAERAKSAKQKPSATPRPRGRRKIKESA